MSFFTSARFKRAVTIGCLLASGLLLSRPALAQATGPTMSAGGEKPGDVAYTGPRFPGGPDSLRAVLARTLRRASPTLTGQLYLHLKLDETGVVSRAYFLTSADRATAELARTPAAQRLADELLNKLSVWQLPEPRSKAKTAVSSVTLPLWLGAGANAMPLPYSDEAPLFPVPAVAGIPSSRQVLNLSQFLMYQVRYPAEDLRNQRQGTVYAYFEVSETGAVEQRRIVGSVSPTLDAEVLRALQNLPDALTPPRQQGRPVRVAYLLPAKFSIQ